MIIYIGSDHRGFKLKEYLRGFLKERGYEVVDVGDAKYDEGDDFVEYAEAVARKVSVDFENARGVLICGSGVGVDVVANKFVNVRSSLASTPDQAFDARNDDDANVLCLGANYLDEAAAGKIVATWLSTPFSGEVRFTRRLKKISDLETRVLRPLDGSDQE